VVGGRERQTTAQALPPCGEAERSLGRDVHAIWAHRFDPLADGAAGAKRELDLGVGRTRHCLELIGRNYLDAMPECLALALDL
jgi:hypothetical protein